MTIHRLIQNLAFNQDYIERLAAAYEEALLALHISDRDDPINKVIAQRIIYFRRSAQQAELLSATISPFERSAGEPAR